MTKKEKAYYEKAMKNLATLKVGDFVKIVDCAEAEIYGNHCYVVVSEPTLICGTWCLEIYGNFYSKHLISTSKYYDVACLEKDTTEKSE